MTCTTCKHSDSAQDMTGKVILGEGAPKICRRYPPLPMVLPSPNGKPGIRNVWPVMQPTDFCGEWAGKIVAP
jgi:hypothetical protein